MIARRARSRGPAPMVAALVVVLALGALYAAGRTALVAAVAPYAAAPVCIVSLVLALVPPSPRYLRETGWTLIGVTALTMVILVVTLR